MTTPRVRIAPSPTGDPHVGTAYIGLFNMVFARKHGGRFVLRIEDTDQVRSSSESEAAILQSLKWIGLEWDEGPDIGGDYGPYRQSERTEQYRTHTQMLVESGHAYPCFCTADELTEMRDEQKRNKLPLRYDGRCREIPTDDARRRMEAGDSHVIRLRVDREGTTLIPEHLRGEITYENEQIDDQVLLKSDGFPTYHLANVVDDHLMGITHVIRAEEWIPSTPKHIMLYEAFGWDPPVWIHMPLLRNEDKSKISKRKNPVSLDYFRRAGILPEALLNFLGLMGWSIADDVEKFDLDEMVEAFTWDRMSLGGPVFNMEKLEWLNGVYIREMDPEVLSRRILDSVFPAETMAKVVPLLQERLQRLDEFVAKGACFFSSDVNWDRDELLPKDMDKKTAYRGMKELTQRIDAIRTWQTDEIEKALREFTEDHEAWTTKSLFMLIRLVVTGSKASPPLFESMEALGKALCQDRFRRAMLLLRP